MTRRLIFGLTLAAAVASAGIWPFGKKDKAPAKVAGPRKPATQNAVADKAAPKPTGIDSVYTKGTVAAIPQMTPGKLDLTDTKSLNFHYGKPTWSLAYSRIQRIEVADKVPPQLLHVPYLQKRKRIVVITFDNDRAERPNMELEFGLDAAAEALPLLEERAGKQAIVEGAHTADGWWGDRYWRTADNAQKWDDAANGTQRPKTVAQAKD